MVYTSKCCLRIISLRPPHSTPTPGTHREGLGGLILKPRGGDFFFNVFDFSFFAFPRSLGTTAIFDLSTAPANLRRIFGEVSANLWRSSGEPLEDLRRTFGEPLANLRRTFVEVISEASWQCFHEKWKVKLKSEGPKAAAAKNKPKK